MKAARPDWVVAVSGSETASGELAPDTQAAAHAAFHEHGCVLLRGAFPPATIEAMHREYLSQFGTMDLATMRDEAAKPPPSRFLRVQAVRKRFSSPKELHGTSGDPLRHDL
jgi:hypothetical protein